MTMLAALERVIADLGKQKEEMFAAIQRDGWRQDALKKKIPGSVKPWDADMGFPHETVIPERRALPSSLPLDYQRWHSACRAIIAKNQPDRLAEFVALYAPPKSTGGIKDLSARKHVTKDEQHELVGLIDQQYAILAAVPNFLRSSLYDIELTAYSVLMDDEVEAAKHLLTRGFNRAAGAMAGVVLERHLKNLLRKHVPPVQFARTATLGKLNDACKEVVYDVPTWRKVQHLTDLRNLCDHEKGREPTKAEIGDLIAGVSSVMRTTNPQP